MNSGNFLNRFASAILVVGVGVVVSGTKACQTDYELGVQASVPTGTVTATVTPIGGSNTSSNASSSSTSSSSSEQSSDDQATTEDTGGENGLFQELSKLGADSPSNKAPAVAGGVVAAGLAGINSKNWLGEAFSRDEDGTWQDSDGDGFNDEIEEDSGSEPNNAAQFPRGAVVTRLEDRVSVAALSPDALREGEEISDSDRDGVSDETEERRGMNPQSVDSDGDGLLDSKELAVGSNPLKVDSDRDGVSDGREVEFGADPTIAEPRRGID
jgi:hypothetical protein